jgi:hypothetical protein
VKRRSARACFLFAACALALAGASSASASPALKLGIMDDARVFAESERTFGKLRELRPRVLRVNLHWNVVARRQPSNPSNHRDPSYNWSAYDRLALEAKARRIGLLFTIVSTPRWANGWRDWNYPPRRFALLQSFAFAAASRYSGRYDASQDPNVDVMVPRVKMWAAWNEPNLEYFLRPVPRPRGMSYASAAARTYAKICNAVVRGVHAAQRRMSGEKVACGLTSPRRKARAASTGPLEFLAALRRTNARFDVYAHHPHPPIYTRRPGTPPDAPRTVTLGNIGVLTSLLNRLYGPKRLWITEYAYQTRPPDYYGVSLRGQAAYLREAYAIAKRHPRIDMLVWFLLRDERTRRVPGRRGLPGWQSGLLFDQRTHRGRAKPSFAVFRCLARRHSTAAC